VDSQLVKLTEVIVAKVGQPRFRVWFNNSTRIDCKEDGELFIYVPNDFIGEWINSHYSKPIQEAAHEVFGGPLNLRFAVLPQLFDTPPNVNYNNGDTRLVENKPPAQRPMAIGTSMPTSGNGTPGYSSRARLRHDLESFVVGPGNQLAYKAALHVAELPGSQYTPLFIHGGCGLGKTHLLQGICRKFIDLHPSKRWIYLTGEEFTNEYITAVRNGKLDNFRRRMRDMDLLVIDDVHFLSGKRGTQEEFLHTFNAIAAVGRQVVMASDNHPKLIQEFGESLINRFVSGMVVRVDPPNFQMRCEIIKRLAERQHLLLDEQVIIWIARRVTQNVREIEGAITRITAHVKLSGRNVDEQLVHDALADLDRQHINPIHPDGIVHVVCTYFGIAHKDLLSKRRDHGISLPRSIAMYLIRNISRMSYPEIGELLNKKNHSTVISACKRVDKAIASREIMEWNSPLGVRREEASELLQRLEEQCRAGK